MKIRDFVGQMTTGMARTNRYSVNIPMPTILKQNQNDIRKMLLFCDQVSLPGLNINTTQVRTFGEIREMPYEMNYDAVQMSFYVDGDMVIKGLFDNWIKGVQTGTSRNFNYYNDYISDPVSISVENLQDKTTYTVLLYEAYPKTVSAVQMGYDQRDIMKLSVTMMYKYWESSATILNQTPNNSVLPTVTDYIKPEVQNMQTTVTNYIEYENWI
jgi:hypothetical protein